MLKNTLQKQLENIFIKKINYELEYNVQTIYNKHFSLSKQKFKS